MNPGLVVSEDVRALRVAGIVAEVKLTTTHVPKTARPRVSVTESGFGLRENKIIGVGF